MLKKYSKPYPTIGEIIAGKDYDYVSYRGYDEKRNYPPATGNNTDGEFCGCFKVVNGEIIPLDGDYYGDDETVIASEEWTIPSSSAEFLVLPGNDTDLTPEGLSAMIRSVNIDKDTIDPKMVLSNHAYVYKNGKFSSFV